jgi:hypothetical protein
VDDLKIVKRLNYFDHQFLRAKDFTDEQDYHVGLRRSHNRHLHTWGIASGLEVQAPLGSPSVKVTPGVAIDGDGREIVLPAEQTVELSGHSVDSVFITIAYDELESDETKETGAAGNTRWTEQPEIVAYDIAPGDPSQRIILALVVLDASRKVAKIDPRHRQVAGVAGGSVTALEIALRADDIAVDDWVRLRLEKPDVAGLAGSLNVTGNISASGSGAFGAGLSVIGATATLAAGMSVSGAPGTFANGISITGTATMRSGLTVLGGGASFSNGVAVAGAATFASGVTVSGGTGTFQGGLSVTGNATFASAVSVSGPLTVTGPLSVSGAATFAAISASGLATLSAALSVTGNAAFASSLTVAGTTTTGGLTATATASLNVLNVNGSAAFTRGLALITAGTLNVGVPAQFFNGVQVSGGAITPTVGNNEQVGIQFPPDPAGGANDRAFIRYFVESGETTKLLIGVANDADDRLSLMQMGAERLTIFNGNVGLGTQTPLRVLHVEGSEVYSGGPSGGFSFGSRTNPLFNETPGVSGQRWTWFASDGVAQLWSGATRLSVTPGGFVTITGGLVVQGPTSLLGALSVNAGKNAYVTDHFVNALGDALERGDVIVVHANGTSGYYGTDSQIPVPEVDLTEQAYDTRVCGIVEAVHGEMVEAVPAEDAGDEAGGAMTTRLFDADERAQLDSSTVQPGQVGAFVTLGAYAHCKVDADIAPIVAGDLLTTSTTKGHAQKVLDRGAATGAIIGKALGGLDGGRGMIPVFVSLQ